MKLYYHPLSGHSHRARLFLSLIGQPAELIEVDLAQRAHKQPDFMKLNAFGQVPVLVDGDIAVADQNAILVYLSKKFGKTDWLPETRAQARSEEHTSELQSLMRIEYAVICLKKITKPT